MIRPNVRHIRLKPAGTEDEISSRKQLKQTNNNDKITSVHVATSLYLLNSDIILLKEMK